jgi:hypothetical protein
MLSWPNTKMKTDDTAQILFIEALLYAQVFEDTDKAVSIVEQIKKITDTKAGRTLTRSSTDEGPG